MKESRLGILDNCLTAIREANEILQEVHDEEEEAFDNMPEGLQESERGDLMMEAVDTLDEAIGSLEEAISSLEEVISLGDNPLVQEVEPWKKLKVGDVVTHKSLGQGTISEIKGNRFTIEFSARSAQFIFPGAIDNGFITI